MVLVGDSPSDEREAVLEGAATGGGAVVVLLVVAAVVVTGFVFLSSGAVATEEVLGRGAAGTDGTTWS